MILIQEGKGRDEAKTFSLSIFIDMSTAELSLFVKECRL